MKNLKNTTSFHADLRRTVESILEELDLNSYTSNQGEVSYYDIPKIIRAVCSGIDFNYMYVKDQIKEFVLCYMVNMEYISGNDVEKPYGVQMLNGSKEFFYTSCDMNAFISNHSNDIARWGNAKYIR